jgi:uncharacterized membrane protein YjgN (DUF898 family)
MKSFLELVGLIVVLIVLFKVAFAVVLPLLGYTLQLLFWGGLIYLGVKAFRFLARRIDGRRGSRQGWLKD